MFGNHSPELLNFLTCIYNYKKLCNDPSMPWRTISGQDYGLACDFCEFQRHFLNLGCLPSSAIVPIKRSTMASGLTFLSISAQIENKTPQECETFSDNDVIYFISAALFFLAADLRKQTPLISRSAAPVQVISKGLKLKFATSTIGG